MAKTKGLIDHHEAYRLYETPQSKLWRDVFVASITRGDDTVRAEQKANDAVRFFKHTKLS